MIDPLALQAGTLRHTINLQSPTIVQDAAGQPQQMWASSLTTRASITSLSGRELFSAQQYIAEATHRITMRYSPLVRAKMRIVFGGTLYRIEAVNDVDMRHRRLDLLCVEVS